MKISGDGRDAHKMEGVFLEGVFGLYRPQIPECHMAPDVVEPRGGPDDHREFQRFREIKGGNGHILHFLGAGGFQHGKTR